MGSFFVELNELSKVKNRRLKESEFQAYEGYFSLFDFQREQVTLERLGMKLYLFKGEYEGQVEELEVVFNNLGSLEA